MRIRLVNTLDAVQRIKGLPDEEDFEVDQCGGKQVLVLTVKMDRGDDEWHQDLYKTVADKVYDLHSEVLSKLEGRVNEVNNRFQKTEISNKFEKLDPTRLP